jgi:hypothetical protein
MTTPRRRQRIDTMIDAHEWMRRAARIEGEWAGGDPAPPSLLGHQQQDDVMADAGGQQHGAVAVDEGNTEVLDY